MLLAFMEIHFLLVLVTIITIWTINNASHTTLPIRLPVPFVTALALFFLNPLSNSI